MFEIQERKKVKIKIYGKEYEILKPTVGEVRTLQKELRGIKGDEDKTFDYMIEWISKLGLPKEALENLELEQFNDLVTYLSGSKKN